MGQFTYDDGNSPTTLPIKPKCNIDTTIVFLLVTLYKKLKEFLLSDKSAM